MKKATYTAVSILLIFTIVLFSACSDGNSVNEESEGQKSNVKITFENGEIMEVTIADLKGRIYSKVVGDDENKKEYSANLTEGTKILMFNATSLHPIEEGDTAELRITINDLKNVAPIDEEYRSFYHTGKDNGKEGEGSISFNSIQGDRVSATFSGVLYSKSGKKAIIEGVLNTVEKKK